MPKLNKNSTASTTQQQWSTNKHKKWVTTNSYGQWRELWGFLQPMGWFFNFKPSVW